MMRLAVLVIVTKIMFSFSLLFGQNDRIELIRSQQSACDETADAYRIKPRIISMTKLGDTLELEVGFAATCCIEYSPQINLQADTLFIKYEIGDDQSGCSCLCCYSFYHKIAGVKSKNPIVKFYNHVLEVSNEKYYIYPVSYTVLNGDTIRKDKYGLRQGIWFESEKHKIFMSYINNHGNGSGHYYDNGKVKDEWYITDGGTVSREYYETGRLKKECFVKKKDDSKTCREWSADGSLLKSWD